MDWLLYLLLFLLGFSAFVVSTISGGGGAMLMVPMVNFLVSKEAVAPLVHLGNLVGRPSRILLFRNNIRFDILKAYVPWAFIGAFLGAWLFSSLRLEWLQIFLGLFLISTLWQYRWGKRQSSFRMRLAYFGPLGFGVSFLSSLTGATGAVLNPFYLNYGVSKEELIATKAANSFLVATVQIATYAKFGKLEGGLWFYGLAIGLGAAVGNSIGKRLLGKMSDKLFQKLVIGMMVISGVVILIQQFSDIV